jgi:hypothetical protein
MTAAATATAWWLPTVIAAGITLVVFAFWWLTLAPAGTRPAGSRWRAWLQPDDPDRSATRATVVSSPSLRGALPVGFTVRDGIGRGDVDAAPAIALKV